MRVTQAGLLSPAAVARGTAVTFVLAGLVGVYPVAVGGWPVLAVGLAAIAAAILYTGGPWPYGYHGLGDLFTFLFFGPVAVVGTYYVHTGSVAPPVVAVSLPVGFLVTAILVVNNLRDIEADRRAGKRTLAVRLGARGTRIQYALLVGGAFVLVGLLRLAGLLPAWFWLPWLTLPTALSLLGRVWRQEGAALTRS